MGKLTYQGPRELYDDDADDERDVWMWDVPPESTRQAIEAAGKRLRISPMGVAFAVALMVEEDPSHPSRPS